MASGRLILGLVLAIMSGCASVRIVKVVNGTPTEGMPFFLPRPYVSVYEPFVIASEAYLVDGQVSPDGQYVLITGATDDLGAHLKSKLGGAISVSKIKPMGSAPPGPISGGPQSEPESADEEVRGAGAKAGEGPVGEDAEAADAEAGEEPAGDADAEPGPTAQPESGMLNVKVVNDNSAFAVTPNRRFFDILWLNDPDEKYVIQGKSGLGNASIDITLGQGWSLQGLDATVDNSALFKPLLKLYGNSLDLLAGLARAKLTPASTLSGAGGPQADIEPGSSRFEGGMPVTVKVTVVKVVAPGIYPVLKPAEMLVANAANLPQTLQADLAKRLHAPVYPYTNVAFNIYEVIVVEAAKPTGDAPSNLQRYYEGSTQPQVAAVDDGDGGKSEGQLSPGDIMQKVNLFLASRPGSDGAIWKVSDLAIQNDKITAKAHLIGGSNPAKGLESIDKLKAVISERAGTDWEPGDVTVTRG